MSGASAWQSQRTRKPVRASHACETCRQRYAKCDEGRPECIRCKDDGLKCTYRKDSPRNLEEQVLAIHDKADVGDQSPEFDIELDLEEDIPAELEEFVLLARLGVKDEALRLAQDVLWRHIHQFPVFAEIAGFLIEHNIIRMLQTLREPSKRHSVTSQDPAIRGFGEWVLSCSAGCDMDIKDTIRLGNTIDIGRRIEFGITLVEAEQLSPIQVCH